MGALTQYSNDMTCGLLFGVTDWEYRNNASFQEGRNLGRTASKVVTSVVTPVAVMAAASGFASMGGTGFAAAVTAGPSGGVTVLIGGVAVSAEAAIAIAGTAVAVNGIAVTAYIKVIR